MNVPMPLDRWPLLDRHTLVAAGIFVNCDVPESRLTLSCFCESITFRLFYLFCRVRSWSPPCWPSYYVDENETRRKQASKQQGGQANTAMETTDVKNSDEVERRDHRENALKKRKSSENEDASLPDLSDLSMPNCTDLPVTRLG
jgi:hypothetical protein